jgi:hypothetical protein
MRNRRLGLRKGLPDLLVAIPGKCLAFVEMKRIRASYATQEQKEWIDLLNTIPNVEGRVCRGAKEAIDFITSIL